MIWGLSIRRVRSFFALMLLIFSAASVRAELAWNSTPFWRQARLLPPGQQVLAVQAAFGTYDSRFDSRGRVQPLGRPFVQGVTWRRILDSEPSSAGRAEIRDYMRRSRVNDSDLAASAQFQVEREEVAFGIHWTYGLTRRWMIGVELPLVYRRTHVTSSMELTPVLAQTAHKGLRANLVKGNLREKVRNVATNELNSLGYDGIPTQSQHWDWDDINLLSQVQLMDRLPWSWSLQQTLRLPTARSPSLADFIRTSSDDGQVDFGISSLIDFHWSHWRLGHRLGAMFQLPDHLRVRLPSSDSSGEIHSSRMRRDLGDWLWSSLSGNYQWSDRLSFDLEYSFLIKEPDRYAAGDLVGAGLSALGEDGGQELHLTQFGLGYRFGELKRRDGVENKWMATIAYTVPWGGRNSVDVARTTLGLMDYF